jgi:peptidoglycan-associated lipoprotein
MRNRWLFILISICLGLSIGLVGCAKKAVLQETTAVGPAVAAVPKAPAAVAEDRDAREKAAKEAELKDQERQRAEREKAERERAEREKAAAAAAAAASAPEKKAPPLAGMEYIYFDFDKSALKPQARETLKKIAAIMRDNPGYNLLIEGNCDERGTVEYNLRLGERRAVSAKRYLTKLGVDADKIATISYGEEKPVDPRHNKEAWAKNRNYHFVVKQ